MSDRELLELAAKAAGIEYIPGECEKSKESELRFGFWLKFPDGYEVPEGVRRRWNPLTDDGDALRLAVKLCIDVSHDAIGMKSFVYARTVFNDETHIGLSEIFDDESERLDRTRRAITRAAAQIGKEME